MSRRTRAADEIPAIPEDLIARIKAIVRRFEDAEQELGLAAIRKDFEGWQQALCGFLKAFSGSASDACATDVTAGARNQILEYAAASLAMRPWSSSAGDFILDQVMVVAVLNRAIELTAPLVKEGRPNMAMRGEMIRQIGDECRRAGLPIHSTSDPRKLSREFNELLKKITPNIPQRFRQSSRALREAVLTTLRSK